LRLKGRALTYGQYRLAVRDDFQQIAVGIEKIATIVIAPIDRLRGLSAGCPQALLGLREIFAAHPERMMPLTQRMGYPLLTRCRIEWRSRNPEEGQILIPALQQNLITETRYHRESEHLSIKTLRLREVADLNTKMIQPFEFHNVTLPLARIGEQQTREILALGVAEQYWMVRARSELLEYAKVASCPSLRETHGAEEILTGEMR